MGLRNRAGDDEGILILGGLDMHRKATTLELLRALLSHPAIVRVRPSVMMFLCRYMGKFRVRNVGGKLFIHSHLPPINSPAYGRFIREHLLTRDVRPSHAQIGVTNACPQRCGYCYNRARTGRVMDAETILRLIDDLKEMGILWIGFTGGEPLLNKNLPRFVEEVGEDCTSKLFTTGCTLTRELADRLAFAGLDSVSVSLDDWREERHDAVRGYRGAFQAALHAIRLFRETGSIDVGVSSVVPAPVDNDGIGTLLEFLARLGIDEAWLSEEKPSAPELWGETKPFAEEDRRRLVALQDAYNRRGGMTVNYLGHFEGREHFGCCAGHKMVYVDPFGYVSPCVFTPIAFGNVREESIRTIYARMVSRFPSESRCFVNENFRTMEKHYAGTSPIPLCDTTKIMDEVRFSPLAAFFALQYKGVSSP